MKKYLAGTFIAFFLGVAGFNLQGASSSPLPRYPFSVHGRLFSSDEKPMQFSNKSLGQWTIDFYREWKSQYLISGPQKGEYYIRVGDSKDAGWKVKPMTVSEAHGYGMMIAAYMAGSEPQAKMIFDGLNQYYQHHPSEKASHLMAWTQVAGGKTPRENAGSATDGDLDIAFALLLADAQWGEENGHPYKTEAIEMIRQIKKWEMDDQTYLPLLGDFALDAEKKYEKATRTSDWIPDHFRSFARATGDFFWAQCAESCCNHLALISRRYSPDVGLLPDFLEYSSKGFFPARPHFLENEADGAYSYNACRVPWRIGVDALITHDSREIEFLHQMNHFFLKKSGGIADRTLNGYALNGMSLPGREDADLAFVAPMAVEAMATSELTLWKESPLKWTLDHGISEDSYFGNTLKLLCLIAISGNEWNPEKVARTLNR
ncbi:MAG: glycosyl hydrolase family 8 [Verrucomicrobiota bacterium]